jgi:hypothetical protein
MCLLSPLLIVTTVFLSSLSLPILLLCLILILKEQSSEEFSFLLSCHPNLVLVLTNTLYKPSLCCLELISQDHLFNPSTCPHFLVLKNIASEVVMQSFLSYCLRLIMQIVYLAKAFNSLALDCPDKYLESHYSIRH